jgi:hypothetical protein
MNSPFMISLNHKLRITELLKSEISDIPITPATEQLSQPNHNLNLTQLQPELG